MSDSDFFYVFLGGNTSIPKRETTPPPVQTLVPLHGQSMPPYPREPFEPWLPHYPSYDGLEYHDICDFPPLTMDDVGSDRLLFDNEPLHIQEPVTGATVESSSSTPALTDGETLTDGGTLEVEDETTYDRESACSDERDSAEPESDTTEESDGYQAPGTSSGTKSKLVQRTRRKQHRRSAIREVDSATSYRCSRCGEVCGCKSSIIRHIKFVHRVFADSQWACRWCSKDLSRRDSLVRHQRVSCTDVPEGFEGPYPQTKG